MTAADRAICLVREAAQASTADPSRVGGLIELPDAGEVMVVGDLHGNLRNYEAAVHIADLSEAAARHLVLQELVHDLLADQERPCRSWQLVEMAARLKGAFPDRVHLLFGNHEMAELCGIEIAKQGSDLNERFRAGLAEAYGDRAGEVMAAYKDLWRSLPLAARTRHGVFICHSTPRLVKMSPFSLSWFRDAASCDRRERNSPVYDLVWGRDHTHVAADEFARRVECEVMIVGHTPCETGYESPNTRHVILDSKDDNGVYVVLPLDRPLSHYDVLRRIRRLHPAAA